MIHLLLTAFVTTIAAAPVAAAGQPVQDRWEKDVAAYEAADRIAPPPRGEIVFVGSSSILRWDTRAAFPDLTVINRGLSGSEMADAVRFADRIIIPYEPRVVVVYAGDNDISSAGRLSEQVVVEAERLVAKVRARLPETRFVFIGVKPSLARWTQVDRMRAANAMLRAFCTHDDRVAYVDVDAAMLGWDERPRRELFVEDGLHLSAEGYRLWTMLLRPFLTPAPALSTTAARPLRADPTSPAAR